MRWFYRGRHRARRGRSNVADLIIRIMLDGVVIA